MKRLLVVVSMGCFLGTLLPVGSVKASDQPDDQPESNLGLSVDIGLASAFVFRGLNIFQANSQGDRNFLFAPSASYTIGDSGFSIGYWGAYQISGDNAAQIVAAGLGHEQDLLVNWETSLGDQVNLNLGLIYYFYPFADYGVTKTTNPSILEPSIALSFSGPVNVSMVVAYFAGLQDMFSGTRYIYLSPKVSKEIIFDEETSTSLALSFGYKAFHSDLSSIKDNMFDISFDWELVFKLAQELSLRPGVHISWTNLVDKAVGEEYVVWFSLNTAFEI